MTRKEILLVAAVGARLVEIRHEMARGLSVSRYRLDTPGDGASDEFTNLRKARAAFRAQVDRYRAPDSDGGGS